MSEEEDKGKRDTYMSKAEPSVICLIILQCTPSNRNWETNHQKCDSCNRHGDAPCGPSYKKRDDPAFAESRNEVTTHEEDTIRDAGDQPRAPIPRLADEHNGDQPSQVAEDAEESNGQRKRIKLASDKELREEAGCK